MGDHATPFADPARVTEAQFQNRVIDYATMCGWRVHHARPAMRQSGRWSTPIQGHAGFPDLVLARDGVVIIAELKSAKGRLSADQRAWFDAMKPDRAGHPWVDAYVWRPDQWPEIVAALARGG